MKKLLVIGEILVEFMADKPGPRFDTVQSITGPFPSGAPAIFAAQAAKLEQSVSIISAVGNDDFGRLNLDRLRAEGVDVSGVHVHSDWPTGSAFVRYDESGNRNFVFNVARSAAGQPRVNASAQSLIDSADHLHVTGSSFSCLEYAKLNCEAAESIRSRGGTVSFDPNIRKEVLSTPYITDYMATLLSGTDLFLPSGDELTILTSSESPTDAVAELLQLGIRAVVHKKGREGAAYFDSRCSHFSAAVPIREVDPTGAGDCFCSTFVSLWLSGFAPNNALSLATASGALAVAKRGPMEGISSLDDLINNIQVA